MAQFVGGSESQIGKEVKEETLAQRRMSPLDLLSYVGRCPVKTTFLAVNDKATCIALAFAFFHGAATAIDMTVSGKCGAKLFGWADKVMLLSPPPM